MAVYIKLSDRLKKRTGSDRISAVGDTLMALIDNINSQYPGIKNDIYSESKGQLRDNAAISLNGTLITNLKTKITDGDDVFILLNIPGG